VPHKESQPTPPTQQLSGSALRPSVNEWLEARPTDELVD
jgi:hypothetical protein